MSNTRQLWYVRARADEAGNGRGNFKLDAFWTLPLRTSCDELLAAIDSLYSGDGVLCIQEIRRLGDVTVVDPVPECGGGENDIGVALNE